MIRSDKTNNNIQHIPVITKMIQQLQKYKESINKMVLLINNHSNNKITETRKLLQTTIIML